MSSYFINCGIFFVFHISGGAELHLGCRIVTWSLLRFSHRLFLASVYVCQVVLCSEILGGDSLADGTGWWKARFRSRLRGDWVETWGTHKRKPHWLGEPGDVVLAQQKLQKPEPQLVRDGTDGAEAPLVFRAGGTS